MIHAAPNRVYTLRNADKSLQIRKAFNMLCPQLEETNLAFRNKNKPQVNRSSVEFDGFLS